jgi:hypothetical protein
MKKYLFTLLIGLVMACSASKHGTAAASGLQDGNSYETAVVIQEKSETTGVSAEYKWCSEHYPGYKTQSQALSGKNGKRYDVLTIVTADGSQKKVYFDISNFFGKF